MAYAIRFLTLLVCAAATFSAAADPITLTNLWTVPSPGPGDGSPAVAPDGTIYFATWLGQLFALNPDGSRKWVFQAGREIWSSPAVGSDGTVYFGCRDHKCYAIAPDGKLRWQFQTAGWVDSSPALAADGTIYFGSWDTNFYAVRSDGQKAWQFPTGAPIVSSPAIGPDGRIYFGSHDAKLYALNPNGAKAWDYATGGPIISSPALDKDGTVYFTSVDGCFYALKPDGALKWRIRTGGITGSSPVLGGDGTVYVGVNKILWAISPEGKKLWERLATSDNFQQPIEASPTALADGSVVIVSNYGLLTDFPDGSGAAKWYFYLYGHGPSCPALSTNGTIYTFGADTNLGACFQALPTTVPLANSAWPKFRRDAQNTGRYHD